MLTAVPVSLMCFSSIMYVSLHIVANIMKLYASFKQLEV